MTTCYYIHDTKYQVLRVFLDLEDAQTFITTDESVWDETDSFFLAIVKGMIGGEIHYVNWYEDDPDEYEKSCWVYEAGSEAPWRPSCPNDVFTVFT